MPSNATDFGSFRVRPVGTAIGAEVSGVDLTGGVTNDLKEDLNRALLEWKVLFFRDQRMTSEQQRDMARQWGELEVHPFLKAGETPEVIRFAKDETTKGTENIWHSDVTWRQIPSLGSILRAIEVPAVGGDTMWADMALAYDGLPESVRAQVDGLTAIHDFSDSFGQGMSPARLEKMREEFPPASAPGDPGAPRDRPAHDLRQRDFHQPYRRSRTRGEQPALGVPLRAGQGPRVPVSFPLGARLDRLLGQSVHPALCDL
jgi:hypothetical protein